MAAITPNSVISESLGSLTLKIVNLTNGSTSDTYTMGAGLPIVGAWIESQNPAQRCSYVASTGVFTIVTTSGTTPANLFVLMRGA